MLPGTIDTPMGVIVDNADKNLIPHLINTVALQRQGKVQGKSIKTVLLQFMLVCRKVNNILFLEVVQVFFFWEYKRMYFELTAIFLFFHLCGINCN